MPFILAYPDLMPNLLPIKKMAKHQEREKMTIKNIFADTLCNLYDAPICFALMVSWGDYKMNFVGLIPEARPLCFGWLLSDTVRFTCTRVWANEFF